MSLNRDQILAKDDNKYEEVDVPEWGGTVRVKALSSAGLIQLAHLSDGMEDLKLMDRTTLARIVIMTTVDESGEYLFTEDDIEKVSEKNGR